MLKKSRKKVKFAAEFFDQSSSQWVNAHGCCRICGMFPTGKKSNSKKKMISFIIVEFFFRSKYSAHPVTEQILRTFDKAKDSLLVKEPSRFTRCKILSQVIRKSTTLSQRHIKIVSIRKRRHGRMMPSSQFRINANNEFILCITLPFFQSVISYIILRHLCQS